MANKKVGLYKRRRKRNVVNDVAPNPMAVGQMVIPMQNQDPPPMNYFETRTSIAGMFGEYIRPMVSVAPVCVAADYVANPVAMENDYGPAEIRVKKKGKKLRSAGTSKMQG